MTEVWVLSEESPFEDPEVSGGCVCGVYATPAAALFALATEILGLAELETIHWTQSKAKSYEGFGYGDAIYILQAHPVETEEAQRAFYTDTPLRQDRDVQTVLALSSADLLARLTQGTPSLEETP